MEWHNLGVEGIEPHQFYISAPQLLDKTIGYWDFDIHGSFACMGIEFAIVNHYLVVTDEFEVVQQTDPTAFYNAYITAWGFYTAFIEMRDVLDDWMKHATDFRKYLLLADKSTLDRYSNYAHFLGHFTQFQGDDARKFWESAIMLVHCHANLKDPKPGYIYLLRAVTPHSHYKIGLSKEPVKRIESMGVLLPFPIEPLHQFPTNHRFKAEKSLHDRYADKRVNGEWFNLSEQDVQDICAIDRMIIEGVRP